MTIGFNEIARRYDVIANSDSNASREEINNIVLASIGMTDSEFDAVVFKAKVDLVRKESYARLEAQDKPEVEPVAKTTYDITTEILKAKYAKGAKQ